MPTNEDLYREIEEEETADDIRFNQRRAKDAIKAVKRKEPNAAIALQRYEREIKPVLEARKRIEDGLPPTDNPIRNAWLRLTGQDRIVEREGFAIVEPSKGLVLEGPSVEEVAKEIAANPEKFKHLSRQAPQVQKVEAQRRTPGNLPAPR